MKKENRVKNNIAVYQAKNGAIELRADSEMETVGKTKKQVILTAKQLNEFYG